MFAERYRLRRPIARGSMGMVYEAEQLPLGRAVAIKVLAASPHQVAMADLASRFLREASLLSRLSHPNTVRVFDYGVEDGQPFLVMELVRGRTLAAMVDAGPLTPLRLIRIAGQICGSLSEAHQAGIIHRDLKPANVLVATARDGTDVVKVVDFGLVKEVEGAAEVTAAGTILGTPQFMAPEQIRARPLDQRVDVYAMGVLLFRCLAGAYPFAAVGPAAVIEAHLSATPRPLREVRPDLQLPDAVQRTIDRCLAKDRAQRFADAAELQHALRLCEASLTDASTGTFATPAATPAPPRRSLVGPLLVGLLLTMLAGLAVGYGLSLGLAGSWPQEAT